MTDTAQRSLLSGFLSEDEFAKEVKRSPKTLGRWRRERKGPPWVETPFGVQYPIEEGRDWLRSKIFRPDK